MKRENKYMDRHITHVGECSQQLHGSCCVARYEAYQRATDELDQRQSTDDPTPSLAFTALGQSGKLMVPSSTNTQGDVFMYTYNNFSFDFRKKCTTTTFLTEQGREEREGEAPI